MIKIICASHGPMASAIIDSAKMLYGESEHVCAITLSIEDTIENFAARLEAESQDNRYNEILILVDIPGGTPSNQSMILAATNTKIHVLAGLNLMMLLEAMIQCTVLPCGQLISTLQQSAKNSIQEMKIEATSQKDQLDDLLD